MLFRSQSRFDRIGSNGNDRQDMASTASGSPSGFRARSCLAHLIHAGPRGIGFPLAKYRSVMMEMAVAVIVVMVVEEAAAESEEHRGIEGCPIVIGRRQGIGDDGLRLASH